MTLRLAVVAAVFPLAFVAGCGSETTGAERDALQVTAAFYPLQFAVEQVGGEHVEVTGLTKAGAEPHDLELTPKDVGSLAKADVVVYERGFQPAVDAAVEDQAREAAFDVTEAAGLDLAAAPQDHEGPDEVRGGRHRTRGAARGR